MFFVVEPDRSRLADLAQRLGEDGSSRSSGRCARSPKRLLRFPQTGELPEKRSSGSSKADWRLRAHRGRRDHREGSAPHLSATLAARGVTLRPYAVMTTSQQPSVMSDDTYPSG
jgi:hypothetical protein